MAKENTTIYAILGLLNHHDMTGYDIKKRIDASISNFWELGYGQIYPTLKQLDKEGYVTKSNEKNEKGPDRIVYSITSEGRKQLTEWLSSPADKEYVKYEILLKLFFGSLLPIEDNIKRVTDFKEKNLKILNTMELYKKSLSSVLSENTDHYYYYLTVLFGEHVYKAYVDWADEAEVLLNKMQQEKKI